MFESFSGEFSALLTVLCWTISAHMFELTIKRAGVMPVNIIRLLFGIIFFCLLTLTTKSMFIPLDAPGKSWLWLSVSGIIGFAIGDYSLFRAFKETGARLSLLIMSTVPPITALIGWLILGETLSLQELTGMALTISGISFVILSRRSNNKKNSSPSYSGIFWAFGGALGQAVGLVLSKQGMGDYNAFSSTYIRIIAGVVGVSFLLFLTKGWNKVYLTLKNRQDMKLLGLGSFFSLFLGVSFSLLAVQNTETGIAATIMALLPLTIIITSIIFFKEKITISEIIGSFIAVFGAILLFL
ncbi:MAG: DMT family transporter [Candidatus Aminicenantaceae bacterium]